MRITVNLSLFFHDHRCSAKIFINEKIKVIKDLENRISEIFNIHDFYLKCDNQYLPPSEDINVLNYDDIVWALPKLEDQTLIEKNLVLNAVETEENEKPQTKKKKKQKESSVEDDEVSVKHKKKKRDKRKRERTEESPERNEKNTTKPHKKSKLKVQETHEPGDESPEINEDNTENNTNKKSKLKVKETLDDSALKDSGRDSFDSNKSDESQSKSVSVKTLVDSFENKKDLKECLEHSFTPILPKKTNIVKTIIICHNKLDSATPTTSNDSKLSIDENDTSTKSHNNEDTDLMNSYSDTDNGDARKRKRKRVRRRRRPTTCREVETDISEKYESAAFTLIPRPLLSKNRHVRFKDSSEVIPSPESTATNELAIVNENVEKIDDPKEHSVASNGKIDLTKVINNNELTEEFIMKQPAMQHIQPRKGDIIAFKIIRISENYTPEVSTRIIGKVTNYDLEKMDVTFDVLHGQEQLAQPQGKFSLDLNDEEPEEKIDNTFHCTWSSVLDPRLLYP